MDDLAQASAREQLDQLYSLVKTVEWRLFLDIKKDHSDHLQEEVNKYLAKGEYRLADRTQAKLEENQRDVELLRKRMDEIKKQLPQKEEGF